MLDRLNKQSSLGLPETIHVDMMPEIVVESEPDKSQFSIQHCVCITPKNTLKILKINVVMKC